MDAAPSAPDQVTIVSMVVAGPGCPPGTTSSYVTLDGLVLGLGFGELDARVGPGIPPSQGSERCGVTLLLEHAEGWSYSLVSAVYRGRADLAQGVIGEQTSTYWFPGETRQEELSTTLSGPFFGPYVREDRIAMASVWSPCGARRPLKIDVEISASALDRGATGFMNVKHLDVALDVTYGVEWRRC